MYLYVKVADGDVSGRGIVVEDTVVLDVVVRFPVCVEECSAHVMIHHVTQ